MNINTNYQFDFQKIFYDEDCSPTELEAIKANVFVYDDDILYYKEIPLISQFSIKIQFDEVERLGNTMNNYGLLIDVTECKPPNSRARRAINKRFAKICENVEHVAFWTGKNVLINTAIRFIMYQTNLDSFSIHETQEAAFEAIKTRVNE